MMQLSLSLLQGYEDVGVGVREAIALRCRKQIALPINPDRSLFTNPNRLSSPSQPKSDRLLKRKAIALFVVATPLSRCKRFFPFLLMIGGFRLAIASWISRAIALW
jgi:hypothetical protein